MKRLLLITVTLLTLGPAQAGMNLIQDGGFEAPLILPGSPWLGNGVRFEALNSLVPHSGVGMEDLTGGFGLETTYQDVATTPGDAYEVAFWLASDDPSGWNGK